LGFERDIWPPWFPVRGGNEPGRALAYATAWLAAWELTAPDQDYHDLEDRSAIGKLPGWDKTRAFESLKRPFDPDAPRFIEYREHAEHYGTALHPHESDH